MTRQQVRDVVLHLLHEIAPEAPVRGVPPDADLCDTLLLDSIDFLNFVVAVDETLHVDVPQADYQELMTLRRCVDYLTRAYEQRT
jgi:acyl carrier protein